MRWCRCEWQAWAGNAPQVSDGQWVAMSRGEGSVCCLLSWVWLQTVRWAQRDYMAATSTQQRGKTTPDASDGLDRRAQRACAEGDGGALAGPSSPNQP